MTAENGEAIRSVTDALLVARQARGAGRVIPIAPCVKVDPAGNTVICPKLDQTLKTLCKEPDGVLPMPGGIECPRQYGQLTTRVNGAGKEPAIQL